MVSDTLLLLRNYWRIDGRGDSRRSRVIWLILRGVALVAAVAFSALVGFGAGNLVANPEIGLQIRLGTMPGLLLTLVMFSTLVVGINQGLRGLYLTNDMELLFSAPIRSESVLMAKLLSRVPTTIILSLVLTIPALIGFGVATGLGPAFYIAGVIALLLAPLFGLAAGALVAMLIVRVLPAARVTEYLGAVSILLGFLVAVLFQLPRLMAGGDDQLDAQTVEAFSGLIEGLEGVPLPSMWAGRGLVSLAEGRIVSALGDLSLFFLLTAGLFAVTVLLADKLYLSGWLRMQGSGITRGQYSEESGVFGGRSIEVGIAYKDWLMRLRDPRQLANLAGGVLFAIFFGFILLRPDDSPDGFEQFVSPGMILSGIAFYAGWITFIQPALNALSLEGRSFYILKAAPVDVRMVFRGKVSSFMAPYALLATVILGGGWFVMRYELVWAPYAWLCLMLIGYGMLTINTGFGFLYPRLDWDDPRRMSSRAAGWRSLLLSALYGLLGLGVAAGAFILAGSSTQWTLLILIVALLILAALSWGVSLLMTRRVVKAWAGLELAG